jgi:hypothetical protein
VNPPVRRRYCGPARIVAQPATPITQSFDRRRDVSGPGSTHAVALAQDRVNKRCRQDREHARERRLEPGGTAPPAPKRVSGGPLATLWACTPPWIEDDYKEHEPVPDMRSSGRLAAGCACAAPGSRSGMSRGRAKTGNAWRSLKLSFSSVRARSSASKPCWLDPRPPRNRACAARKALQPLKYGLSQGAVYDRHPRSPTL